MKSLRDWPVGLFVMVHSMKFPNLGSIFLLLPLMFHFCNKSVPLFGNLYSCCICSLYFVIFVRFICIISIRKFEINFQCLRKFKIVFLFDSLSIYFFGDNSLTDQGSLLRVTLSKLVNLFLSSSLSWSLNTDGKHRLFLLFSCYCSCWC